MKEIFMLVEFRGDSYPSYFEFFDGLEYGDLQDGQCVGFAKIKISDTPTSELILIWDKNQVITMTKSAHKKRK